MRKQGLGVVVQRCRRRHYRRQFIQIDFDQFRGVACLRRGIGDNGGKWLFYVVYVIGCQYLAWFIGYWCIVCIVDWL